MSATASHVPILRWPPERKYTTLPVAVKHDAHKTRALSPLARGSKISSKQNRRYRSRNRPTRIVDGAPDTLDFEYMSPDAPKPKVNLEEIQKFRMSNTAFREGPDEEIIKHIQSLEPQRMQQQRLQALQQQQRQMMAQQMYGNMPGGMQMMGNMRINPAQMAQFHTLQQRHIAARQQQAPNALQVALLAAQHQQLVQAQHHQQQQAANQQMTQGQDPSQPSQIYPQQINLAQLQAMQQQAQQAQQLAQAQHHRQQQEANQQMAQGQHPNQPGGARRGRQSLRQINARSLAGVINKDTISRDNTIGEKALEAKLLAIIAKKIDRIPQQAKQLQAGHGKRWNRDKRVRGNSPSLSPVAVERSWGPPDDG